MANTYPFNKPRLRNYKRFLIAVGTHGVYKKNMQYAEPFDTMEDFGLYIKHAPCVIEPGIKEPITVDWPDEHGADVFLPEYAMSKAYDIEVEFVSITNDGNAILRYHAFLDRIRSKWLQMYDEYTNLGRNAVYMKEFDKEPTYVRRNNREVLIFKVLFGVNDPDSTVVLTHNRA